MVELKYAIALESMIYCLELDTFKLHSCDVKVFDYFFHTKWLNPTTYKSSHFFFWGLWLLYNHATLFTWRIFFQRVHASTCLLPSLQNVCTLPSFKQKHKWLIWVFSTHVILGPCHNHNNNSPMHPFWTTTIVVIF